MIRQAAPTQTPATPWWIWAVGVAVILVIAAALGLLIYRSRHRKRAAAIVAVSVVWVLGVGGALSQLVPGITQRLPVPFSLEGQRDVREVSLAQAKELAAFPVYSPTYLPGKLASESVRVQRAGRSSGVVVMLLYYDPRSSSQVEIRQSQAGGPAISPGQANLSIMGQNAKVTSSASGSTVEWSIGSTLIQVAGEYPKEQLIQMARSMR